MEARNNPLSILLVDDNADDHLLVCDLLSQFPRPGIRLRWVTDCKSAADAIRAETFDVCILGCQTGIPKGLESWEAVRPGRRLPLVLLSGDESDAMNGKASRIEADACLMKDRLSPSLLDRSIRHATARRKRKDELLKYKRLMLFQSEVSRAILHIEDEVELLQELCRALVEAGGYLTAWVGYLEDDKDRTVTAVAKHGLEENSFQTGRITPQVPERDDPTGVSICTGAVSVFRSVENDAVFARFRAEAMKSRSLSVIGLPLFSEGKVLGAVSIHSSEADAFEADEIEVLRGICDILSHRIQDFRLRRGHMQAEEKYRTLFENAVPGIYQSTLTGRFTSINPAFAQILRYESPDEVVNTITDISRQVYADPERRMELLRLLAKRDMVREFEARFLRKDGDIAWVVLNMRAVRDGEGNIAYLEGSIWDITDRKNLETHLIQAQKMEAIGTLAGGIAHDFNNILAAIMGYAELMQQNVPDAKTYCYTEQILKSCARANNLVSQILTFSRRAEPEPGPIDMAQLTRESLKLVRAMFPSTIEIRTKFSPKTCTVMGDSMQLHQIMMNLFTNAAYAMREQGGLLEVVLDSTAVTSHTAPCHDELSAGVYVMLVVHDTGTGISPSIINRIFDPFFTTKESGAGAGLGLSMVYAIVKERGGTITVESEWGKGSVFTVYLPAVACKLEAEGKTGEMAPGSDNRMLLSDDGETAGKAGP